MKRSIATCSRSRRRAWAAFSPPEPGPRQCTGCPTYPEADWPPVVIPFFAFRIMVGMGLVMLAISWFGNWLRWRERLETTRWFLWCAFLAFPTGFVAVLSGWFTAEVGRQPWVVWGLLRTADAMTPTLTAPQVLATLIGYVVVYAFIFVFGARLHLPSAARRSNRCRCNAGGGDRQSSDGGGRPCHDGNRQHRSGEMSMDPVSLVNFWAGVIAFAILVYVSSTVMTSASASSSARPQANNTGSR